MWSDILPVIVSSMEAGTFDNRTDRHFSWTPMQVDEQGWHEVHAVLDEALPKLLEAKEKSEERLLAGGPSLRAAALMVCFESAVETI